MSDHWVWPPGRYSEVSLHTTMSLGNGQLVLVRSREVATSQGLLNKVSLVDFNPDPSFWPLY